MQGLLNCTEGCQSMPNRPATARMRVDQEAGQLLGEQGMALLQPYTAVPPAAAVAAPAGGVCSRLTTVSGP
jgi:hypothetical protein